MPKGAGGRPTKYRAEYCERVIELMSEGYAIVEVAAELGVVKQTLYDWKKAHKDFLDALKMGQELSEAWWMTQGRNALKDKEFNAVLWYMNMKNRHGWRDKIETDNKHEVTLSIAEQIKAGHDARKRDSQD